MRNYQFNLINSSSRFLTSCWLPAALRLPIFFFFYFITIAIICYSPPAGFVNQQPSSTPQACSGCQDRQAQVQFAVSSPSDIGPPLPFSIFFFFFFSLAHRSPLLLSARFVLAPGFCISCSGRLSTGIYYSILAIHSHSLTSPSLARHAASLHRPFTRQPPPPSRQSPAPAQADHYITVITIADISY